MIRQQARRGAHAVVTTAVALALGVTLAPAGHAATTASAGEGAGTTGARAATTARAGAIDVRLRVGRRAPRAVTTPRAWATHLLADQKVSLDRSDFARVVRDGSRVTGQRQRRLRDGDAVHVVRVRTVARSTRHRINRGTTVRKVARLRPGQRRVVRSGRPGMRRATVRRTLHNGRVVRANRTSRVLRKPVRRTVLVGRRSRSVPGASRLNWTALARCESSNNPRAVNPAGYYGLYQFSRGTWRSVGGSGLPSRASRQEQTFRAQKLWKSRGRSPWPHCGRLL